MDLIDSNLLKSSGESNTYNLIMTNYLKQNNNLMALLQSYEDLMEKINDKLLYFVKVHCQNEFEKLSESHIIKSNEKGSMTLILKNEGDTDDGIAINEINRCVDKKLNINKLISVYDLNLYILKAETFVCNTECLKTKANSESLGECFNFCTNMYFSQITEKTDMLNIQLERIHKIINDSNFI